MSKRKKILLIFILVMLLAMLIYIVSYSLGCTAKLVSDDGHLKTMEYNGSLYDLIDVSFGYTYDTCLGNVNMGLNPLSMILRSSLFTIKNDPGRLFLVIPGMTVEEYFYCKKDYVESFKKEMSDESFLDNPCLDNYNEVPIALDKEVYSRLKQLYDTGSETKTFHRADLKLISYIDLYDDDMRFYKHTGKIEKAFDEYYYFDYRNDWDENGNYSGYKLPQDIVDYLESIQLNMTEDAKTE